MICFINKKQYAIVIRVVIFALRLPKILLTES